jgi:hypothetical protein
MSFRGRALGPPPRRPALSPKIWRRCRGGVVSVISHRPGEFLAMGQIHTRRHQYDVGEARQVLRLALQAPAMARYAAVSHSSEVLAMATFQRRPIVALPGIAAASRQHAQPADPIKGSAHLDLNDRSRVERPDRHRTPPSQCRTCRRRGRFRAPRQARERSRRC